MTTPRRTPLLCNCNRTMQLDGKSIAGALGLDAVPHIHSELCRRHIAAFEAAAKGGDDLLVACTQEAPLFEELHAEFKAAGDIRFANIRETAGWSADTAPATPKIAALLAAADLPAPEPVPTVSYASQGQLLIIGQGEAAIQWAERLAGQLHVSVLIAADGGRTELPLERRYPVYSGRRVRVTGYLGAFDVAWEQTNPIDLETCTRCNACVRACPEQAIGYGYQIDLDKCKSHRHCVKACGEVKAIDFSREARTRDGRFDLVMDLSPDPLIWLDEPPQGYFAPGRDPLEQAEAARRLAALTGEFGKPKFFAYQDKICAHARSGITGCTQCIDACSTTAISADGDHVKVEPHLCMGCGGCATTCPTGAMTYAFPRVADIGMRVKTLLAIYRKADGEAPCLLFHNATAGRELVARLGQRGKGLPAAMIPVETFHIASLGMDALLGAIAYGATHVLVLSTGSEAPQYIALLRREMEWAQSVLTALGYGAGHLRLIAAQDVAALEAAVWHPQSAPRAPVAAGFNLSNDKRTTLDFIFDHLTRHAPQPRDEISLGRGAPYGAASVDRQKCTLCMACVGACPAGALLDSKEQPQLRFIERNCVQCGLCAKTCPEDAIRLTPRLLLGGQAGTATVLNEAAAFACTKCGKPFATRQMIDGMLARLGKHAMFSEPGALERLKMCTDCRVLDLMQNAKHGSIFDSP